MAISHNTNIDWINKKTINYYAPPIWRKFILTAQLKWVWSSNFDWKSVTAIIKKSFKQFSLYNDWVNPNVKDRNSSQAIQQLCQYRVPNLITTDYSQINRNPIASCAF